MADNVKGGGYINDRLTTDLGEMINATRHQIVGQVYLKDFQKDGYVLNHKNENKVDNRVKNLEWITNHYNLIYSQRGLKSQQPLFDAQALKIKVEDEKTKTIKKVLHNLQVEGYIPPTLEKILFYKYTNDTIN